MSHELELTLLNSSPQINKTINLNDELPAKALKGILQTAFGRESTKLDEWTVVLTLRPVREKPGTVFNGETEVSLQRQGSGPVADHRPLVRQFDEYGEYYGYADFDYDDEFYWPRQEKPNPDIQFKELLKEARKVASDKPWTVLPSNQIFLCEDYHKEMFFVSITGHEGEEIGVEIYREWDGFRYLLGNREGPSPEPGGLVVTFQERQDMTEEDLCFFKRLNCSFVGKRWPKLRVLQEGEEPRLPDPDEAKILIWLFSCVRSMSSKARKGQEIPVPAKEQKIAAFKSWEMKTQIRDVSEFTTPAVDD